ncbi:MAG: hypothetical protein MO846_07645 [Candidatus Devosia symbiotica]|nr:hypothetical protein [Candidatus Devosia symbiotica]
MTKIFAAGSVVVIIGTVGAGLEAIVDADNVLAEEVDVSDAAAMTGLEAMVAQRLGSPTLLMNNAAPFVAGRPGGMLDSKCELAARLCDGRG